MKVEPQNEHRWLMRLVGEWTYDSEAVMPGQAAPDRSSGTEVVRSIGGLWVVGEMQGTMPGGDAGTMIVTLGFDPAKKRYVGTWIGSMMTNLWLYDGWMDETGRVLTLESEGPSWEAEGKTATYRDVIEIKSDDHRVMTSQMRKADGTWQGFMTMHSRRKRR